MKLKCSNMHKRNHLSIVISLSMKGMPKNVNVAMRHKEFTITSLTKLPETQFSQFMWHFAAVRFSRVAVRTRIETAFNVEINA